MNIKLSKAVKATMQDNRSLVKVMQLILKRESKVDQDREHFWTISFNMAKKVLNIELVSLGSVKNTIAEPMEVYSIPLQKRASSIIVVHNHPSGSLKPSLADKDLTNLLVQCGKILHVDLYDHLIITDKDYFSFRESGLLEELWLSTKYVPDQILQARIKKSMDAALKQRTSETKTTMAQAMLKNNEPITKIMEYTGLSRNVINGLKKK